MIVDRRIGEIFNGPEAHIAFAASDSYNQASFAGMIAFKYWPELVKNGPYQLNTVITRETAQKTFHAMIVYSFDQDGWEEAPRRIRSCLSKIQVPSDEEIAMVAIGTSEFDQSRGADPEANLLVLANSSRKIVLYGLK